MCAYRLPRYPVGDQKSDFRCQQTIGNVNQVLIFFNKLLFIVYFSQFNNQKINKHPICRLIKIFAVTSIKAFKNKSKNEHIVYFYKYRLYSKPPINKNHIKLSTVQNLKKYFINYFKIVLVHEKVSEQKFDPLINEITHFIKP